MVIDSIISIIWVKAADACRSNHAFGVILAGMRLTRRDINHIFACSASIDFVGV